MKSKPKETQTPRPPTPEQWAEALKQFETFVETTHGRDYLLAIRAARPVEVKGKEYKVTPSIGVHIAMEDEQDGMPALTTQYILNEYNKGNLSPLLLARVAAAVLAVNNPDFKPEQVRKWPAHICRYIFDIVFWDMLSGWVVKKKWQEIPREDPATAPAPFG